MRCVCKVEQDECWLSRGFSSKVIDSALNGCKLLSTKSPLPINVKNAIIVVIAVAHVPRTKSSESQKTDAMQCDTSYKR